MTVERALVGFFRGEGAFKEFGIEQMRRDYFWNNMQYDVTLKAKEKLHLKWSELERNPSDVGQAGREALALEIVGGWGGIRGNSSATIARYCTDAVKIDSIEDVTIPFHGIASRSKILSIARPERFVILDARVVISLTAVQLLSRSPEGILLPYMVSRNPLLSATNSFGFLANPEYRHAAIIKRNPDWKKVTRSSAYAEYLRLLRSVSSALLESKLEHKIWDLEMTLFSQVFGLVKQLSTQ